MSKIGPGAATLARLNNLEIDGLDRGIIEHQSAATRRLSTTERRFFQSKLSPKRISTDRVNRECQGHNELRIRQLKIVVSTTLKPKAR